VQKKDSAIVVAGTVAGVLGPIVCALISKAGHSPDGQARASDGSAQHVPATMAIALWVGALLVLVVWGIRRKHPLGMFLGLAAAFGLGLWIVIAIITLRAAPS
jgi:hypothetical protein